MNLSGWLDNTFRAKGYFEKGSLTPVKPALVSCKRTLSNDQ